MTIAPEFLVTLRGGKQYPTWPGVLQAATDAGLKSLTVRVLQIPSAENGNLAVVEATAVFEDGRTFTDVGDCSPASCTPQIASAALRMASTRAKGRCLRDALSIGQTLLEELPDLEDGERSAPAVSIGGCEVCGVVLTAGQATFSRQKFGKLLCPAHQREG